MRAVLPGPFLSYPECADTEDSSRCFALQFPYKQTGWVLRVLREKKNKMQNLELLQIKVFGSGKTVEMHKIEAAKTMMHLAW